MTTRLDVYEWTQREFISSGVSTFRDKGDYYTADSMHPSHDRRSMLRVPGFTARTFPTTPNALTTCQAVFFDEPNSRTVFIGKDSSNYLSAHYVDADWAPHSVVYNLVTGISALGGLHGLNAIYWGGKLYVIGSDGNVYYGSTYINTLSALYSTADAHALAPYGDMLYMATTGGTIYRLQPGGAAFQNIYTPTGTLNVRFLTAYRGYIYAFVKNPAGTIDILRITDDDPPKMAVEVQLRTQGGSQTFALPYLQQSGRLIFSPGPDVNLLTTRSSTATIPMPIFQYRYGEATSLEQIATVILNTTPIGKASIISWRDELWLAQANTAASQYHKFTHITPPQRIYRAEGAQVSLATAATFASTFIATAGPALIVVTADTGFNHSSPDVNRASPCYWQSSYLDCGQPGRQKRLESATVLLDLAAGSSTTVTVAYRTDDNADWTTATTGTGSRQVRVGSLGVTFYQIQFRITITNTTNQAIAIEALSLVFSASK